MLPIPPGSALGDWTDATLQTSYMFLLLGMHVVDAALCLGQEAHLGECETTLRTKGVAFPRE